MDDSILKFVQLAVGQAERSDHNHYRHGAVVFDDKGNIISKGYNSKRVVPKLKKYGYPNLYHHAESYALMKARPEHLAGSSIMVVRVSPTKLSNSKPCVHCMGLLKESGITTIYYSTAFGLIERIYL